MIFSGFGHDQAERVARGGGRSLNHFCVAHATLLRPGAAYFALVLGGRCQSTPHTSARLSSTSPKEVDSAPITKDPMSRLTTHRAKRPTVAAPVTARGVVALPAICGSPCMSSMAVTAWSTNPVICSEGEMISELDRRDSEMA